MTSKTNFDNLGAQVKENIEKCKTLAEMVKEIKSREFDIQEKLKVSQKIIQDQVNVGIAKIMQVGKRVNSIANLPYETTEASQRKMKEIDQKYHVLDKQFKMILAGLGSKETSTRSDTNEHVHSS